MVCFRYHEKFPDVSGSGMKRKPQKAEVALQILEEMVASTKVQHNTEGELMWIKEFVSFAMTYKGGGMSDDSAKAQWATWLQALADGSDDCPITDEKGPPGFERRFWVKTADKVSFIDEFEKRKSLKMAHKEQKKDVQQTDIDKAQKQIFTDYERMGRSSQNTSMKEMAAAMALNKNSSSSGGATSAFDNNMLDVGDVSKFLDDEEGPEEGPEQNDDQEEEAEEEEAEEEEEDEDAKAAEQFEQEHKELQKVQKEQLRSKRNAEADYAALELKAVAALASTETFIKQIQSLPELCHAVKGELDLVRRTHQQQKQSAKRLIILFMFQTHGATSSAWRWS